MTKNGPDINLNPSLLTKTREVTSWKEKQLQLEKAKQNKTTPSMRALWEKWRKYGFSKGAPVETNTKHLNRKQQETPHLKGQREIRRNKSNITWSCKDRRDRKGRKRRREAEVGKGWKEKRKKKLKDSKRQIEMLTERNKRQTWLRAERGVGHLGFDPSHVPGELHNLFRKSLHFSVPRLPHPQNKEIALSHSELEDQ